MKKRILSAILISALLVTSISGCGEDTESTPNQQSNSSSQVINESKPVESSSSSVESSSSSSSKPESSSSSEESSSSSATESSSSSTGGNPAGIIEENGEFAMPKLVGLNWEVVQNTYENSTFMTIVFQKEYSDYAVGEIFEQSVIEGQMVNIGSTITVKVSRGKKKVEIQDVSNKTYEEAKKQLEKDGFKVEKSNKESKDVAEGLVISSNPSAHEMVEQGSTVVLTVSIGAPQNMKIVPKLVGMPITEALKRCNEYNLLPKIDYVDSDEEKGKVLEQSIKPDEKVMPNTEITLKVSKGKLHEN